MKKVEDEGENEIIFMLPLNHYNEIKNDDIRYRGSYRQVMHAVKNLVKYDFNPIFSVTNFYNENKKTLITEFVKAFANQNVQLDDSNFQINEYFNK